MKMRSSSRRSSPLMKPELFSSKQPNALLITSSGSVPWSLPPKRAKNIMKLMGDELHPSYPPSSRLLGPYHERQACYEDHICQWSHLYFDRSCWTLPWTLGSALSQTWQRHCLWRAGHASSRSSFQHLGMTSHRHTEEPKRSHLGCLYYRALHLLLVRSFTPPSPHVSATHLS